MEKKIPQPISAETLKPSFEPNSDLDIKEFEF